MPVAERRPLDQLPRLQSVLRNCETALDGKGRVMVRYSGTEKKLRILVEAAETTEVEHWAAALATAVREEFGA